MAGKTLIFHTAMTVIDASGSRPLCCCRYYHQDEKLKRETIEAYVDLEKPFNCAGSALQTRKTRDLLDLSFQSDDPTAIIGFRSN